MTPVTSVKTIISRGLTAAWEIKLKEILKKEQAEYGQKIVATVSRQLTLTYGRSFNEKNLRRMIQFAEVFPESEIVV